MSLSREDFLNRLRTALPPDLPAPPLPEPLPVSPAADLVAQFAAALEKLQGELVLADTVEEAAGKLLALTAPQDRPWFVADRDLARALAAHLPVPPGSREDLADCQAAITEAEWVIADTGTSLLRLDARQPRGCYLLPEIHVVVAPTSRLLRTLAEALCLMEDWESWPTASVFVTGPSRTADIEKTIVIPAHGPKRQVVILLRDCV